MKTVSIADRAEWLRDDGLQKLLSVLAEGAEEARVAGGAVRNTLFGKPATDIDVATTVLPDETERRAQAAGFKTVPTGKAHGTITVIVSGTPYEVTTLRSDVETDGRHARVVFGRDWKRDAERRDFTINALYATADGDVVDLVGGLSDIDSRTLRFIGEPDARIQEDYLRILRFFRFFAWYGAGRPDAEGLRACTRLKSGISQLSAERVWGEIRKLLSAPDPSRALLWMRQTGVLTLVLPESEKWGIDGIHALVAAECRFMWDPDPMLRLAAIVPPDAPRLESMAERLRLSNADSARLTRWATTPQVKPTSTREEFARIAYRSDVKGIEDRLRLDLAAARARNEAGDAAAMHDAQTYGAHLNFLYGWRLPEMPVNGNDLIALGSEKGKRLGQILGQLEEEWIESNFALGRDALMERAAQLSKA